MQLSGGGLVNNVVVGWEWLRQTSSRYREMNQISAYDSSMFFVCDFPMSWLSILFSHGHSGDFLQLKQLHQR